MKDRLTQRESSAPEPDDLAKNEASERRLPDNQAGESTASFAVPPGPRQSMVQAGHPIGPYVLVRELGRGTFGRVWLAERRGSLATTQVAVKVPLGADTDLAALTKEARVWVQASGHPNVLPVIEAEVYDGQVIIVSEYAPDGSLKQWLGKRAGSALSAEAALSLMTGILSGLEHLHARGIIHRDLKPANILMQGPCPRIADFGLARFSDVVATADRAAGTPAYMAPEAFDGKRSIQTDLWAAGVIFFELLAAARPFPQTDRMALLRAISSFPPAALPVGTPPYVERVIRKCLEKDPDHRYAAVTALLADLRTRAAPVVAQAPDPAAGDDLLHRLWDDLDSDLQDALALAYNQARREKKDRISTRTFFAALARLQPGRLPQLLGLLPEGSLPEPAAADVPTQSQILQDAPKLSSCLQHALLHLGVAKPTGHKLVPEEVFVDIAKFGNGPSVVRLRTHGVTPELVDRFVRQLGWKVVQR
jgi:serine/threonine protein kinase